MKDFNKANQVVALLKQDVLVNHSTIRIEEWEDGIQVEFYIKDADSENDWDSGPQRSTERAIEALGGCRVHMNDCEGCFGI